MYRWRLTTVLGRLPDPTKRSETASEHNAVVPENWSPIVKALETLFSLGIKTRQYITGVRLWRTGKIPDSFPPQPERAWPWYAIVPLDPDAENDNIAAEDKSSVVFRFASFAFKGRNWRCSVACSTLPEYNVSS